MSDKKTLKQKIGAFFIPKLPITRENFNRARFELNAMRTNLNNWLNPIAAGKVRQLKKGTDLSVNVGAGPFGKTGWVNIDMFKYDNVSVVYDCRKKLPFQDTSVTRIRCEHVFEHLDRVDEAPFFLKECYRSLQPGGTLRIVVPDLALFVKAYCSGDVNEWKKIGFDLNDLPWGLKTPMDILNHTFRQDGEHKFGYDFETIRQTILEAGFKTVNKMSWGNSNDPLLQDDLPNHKPYSLYVDCIK